MPQPLPVDVVTTWWDYVVDVADILAGLGTAGALLIAALVYRRQVEDTSRQKASQVTIRALEGPSGNILLDIYNGGDEAIYKLVWDVSVYPGGDILAACTRHEDQIQDLQAFESIRMRVDGAAKNDFISGRLMFTTPNGKGWARDMGGALHELTGKDRHYYKNLREPLEDG